MDLAEFGDLNRLVHTFKAQNEHFTRDQVLCLAVQSAEGLENVHGSGRVLLDLKPQNFFVAGDGTVLIGDFGAAIHPYTMKQIYGPQKLGYVGTPTYMAPEIWLRKLTPEDLADEAILKKVDMWSLGCVLYEVVTLDRAFKSENQSLEGDKDRLKNDVVTGNYKPIDKALVD